MTLQLMERGGRFARVLVAWRDRPNHVLSTVLVGNNLVNIAASVMSVRVAAWFFQSWGDSGQAWADGVAVIGMTLLLLIFAEVSPKTYAKHNAARVAIPAMWFVRFIEIPLSPAAWALTRIGKLVVRLFGGNPSTTGPSVTEEDIEYMIELGARERVFEQKDRADLLEAALEFGEVVAKEVMIPRTESLAIDADTPLEVALQHVIGRGHSRVPVYNGSIDKIIGVLYAKDLLRTVAGSGLEGETLRTLMRSDVFFVPESQKIADTLREMQRRRVHLGVVVDEFGGFSGLVTIEDIIEELVGEIRDEFDSEEDLVRKIDDETFLVTALISIRDLGEVLDVEFPDEGDYETLGGFVTFMAGKLPAIGDVIKWNHLELEVTGADDRHVEKVRIKRLPRIDDESAKDE